jgi:hypothetical protein
MGVPDSGKNVLSLGIDRPGGFHFLTGIQDRHDPLILYGHVCLKSPRRQYEMAVSDEKIRFHDSIPPLVVTIGF